MAGRGTRRQAHFKEGAIMDSSATFPDVVEDGFSRLRETGLRLMSRRYDIEAFEGARMDALCSRLRGWGRFRYSAPETPVAH